MRISLVLPAFNEEARVEQTIMDLATYRQSCVHDLEVICVNDGSSDATGSLLEACRFHIPDMTIAHLRTNGGKGRAVATGMSLATGQYRAFFDADAATPFDALDDLIAAAAYRNDTVAIGSMRAAGSNVVRAQSRVRTLAGRAGNAFVRAAVLPGISDTQRGCKLFPAALAEVVFGSLVTDGWAFDIEVLAKCRRLGYRIVEVPVEWRHVDGSQVRAGAYTEALKNVVRIRRVMRDVDPAAAALDAPAPSRPLLAPARRPV